MPRRHSRQSPEIQKKSSAIQIKPLVQYQNPLAPLSNSPKQSNHGAQSESLKQSDQIKNLYKAQIKSLNKQLQKANEKLEIMAFERIQADQYIQRFKQQTQLLESENMRLTSMAHEFRTVIEELRERETMTQIKLHQKTKQTQLLQERYEELRRSLEKNQKDQKKEETQRKEQKHENKFILKDKIYDALLANGISDVTVQILKSEEIKTLQEVKEMKDEDFRVLGIKMGQVLRLRKINL